MFLDLETFRTEGLENAPGLHILEKHVVTEDYMAQLKTSVGERLGKEGWTEVNVCNQDPVIRPSIRKAKSSGYPLSIKFR